MFTRSKTQVPTWIVLSFLLLSLVGFIDAGYLAVSHFQNRVPTCSIVEGCDIVATSSYSEILGIPVALLGVLYYLFVFVISLIYFDTKSALVKKVWPYIATMGLIASIYFVSIQLFILHAICLYCMASGLTSTLIFVLALLTLRYKT